MIKKIVIGKQFPDQDYTDLALSYFPGAKECFRQAKEETSPIMKINLRRQGLHLQRQALLLLEEANRLPHRQLTGQDGDAGKRGGRN